MTFHCQSFTERDSLSGFNINTTQLLFNLFINSVHIRFRYAPHSLHMRSRSAIIIEKHTQSDSYYLKK